MLILLGVMRKNSKINRWQKRNFYCEVKGSVIWVGPPRVRKSLASRREIQVQIPWKPAAKQHPEQDSTFGKFTMQ